MALTSTPTAAGDVPKQTATDLSRQPRHQAAEVRSGDSGREKWVKSTARGARGRWTRLLGGALCIGAYLYGSLPLVYVLGRWRGVDLKSVGSGNVGGSNLWAAGGAVRGLLGWLFDASKGLLPIAVGRRLGCADETARLAGVCGVAGQCWPVFLRFNGGRGVSAFVGAAFVMDRAAWFTSIVALAGGSVWRVGPMVWLRPRQVGGHLKATRSKSVPLGCFVGVLAFPLVCALSRRAASGFSIAPTLLALVLLLRRLTAPLPDDAQLGPARRRAALLFRLLYDRNTSD